MKIGFIGAGQMAQALASGIAREKPDTEFHVGDPLDAAIDSFKKQIDDCHFVRHESNDDIGVSVDALFIAVKPQYLEVACDDLPRTAEKNPLTLSIATGIKLGQLAKITGIRRLIRVMPNTPSLIGKGAASITPGPDISNDDLDIALDLLRPIGVVRQVPERLIDAIVGVSGSGPAYVYSFIEALSDGGVLMGLPRTLATEFAVETILGAAELVKRSGEHPAVLRERVTSPGGTTIAAMESLEENGFRHAVMSAVRAAAEKSYQLGD